MNGTYFKNPSFDTDNYTQNNRINYDNEQSYIENILRQNIGNIAKIYASFPDSNEWRDKMYEAVIEDAGKDHVILYSKKLDDWYLIPLIYIDWVEFETRINFTKVH